MEAPVIYVVDDDTSVQAALRRLLLTLRLPVLVFASAEQFLAGTRPDARGCLVLDVRLPAMSGLQLQQRMIAEQWALPIIFITAQEDHEAREKAMSCGAADYLHKPTGIPQLLSSVRRALGRAGDSA